MCKCYAFSVTFVIFQSVCCICFCYDSGHLLLLVNCTIIGMGVVGVWGWGGGVNFWCTEQPCFISSSSSLVEFDLYMTKCCAYIVNRRFCFLFVFSPDFLYSSCKAQHEKNENM